MIKSTSWINTTKTRRHEENVMGVLEYWSVGVLECWSVGVLECWSVERSITPLLHYSITPLLHYSTTPLLHYSTTPLLHYSTTPLLHFFLRVFGFYPPLYFMNRLQNRFAVIVKIVLCKALLYSLTDFEYFSFVIHRYTQVTYLSR